MPTGSTPWPSFTGGAKIFTEESSSNWHTISSTREKTANPDPGRYPMT